MSREQRRAHERLCQTLTVREHKAPEKPARIPSRRPRAPAVTPEMVKRMRKMEAAGELRKEIAREFGVCEATITHHLGPKRRQTKAATRVRR